MVSLHTLGLAYKQRRLRFISAKYTKGTEHTIHPNPQVLSARSSDEVMFRAFYRFHHVAAKIQEPAQVSMDRLARPRDIDPYIKQYYNPETRTLFHSS
jgi:hypothetical protein